MDSLLSKLRPVILESPYDLLEKEVVQGAFARLAALKIRGYREVYPYGVLPVDTYDFIATHHLICQTKGDELYPIMGFKTITLERCELHRLPFPGLAVLGSSCAAEHVGALQALLEDAVSRNLRISYGSSWTIDPSVRENPELKKALKEVMGAMLVRWETQLGSGLRITCGAPRVRSDQFFESLGYSRVQSEGEVLPLFKQTSLLGEEAVLLQCEKFSPAALELADRYRFFLSRQEHFKPSLPLSASHKKAA